jgi:GLPGLI family protein
MMNKLIIILLNFYAVGLYAQLELHYNFTTNLKGVAIKKNAILQYNMARKESEFRYDVKKGDGSGIVTVDYKGNVGDETMKVEFINQSTNITPMDFYFCDEQGSIIRINYKTKTMNVREIITMDPFVYQEPSIPKINWEISKESKTILDYKCLKATCQFRGRKYTAWFADGIVPYLGPWKLTGLPGTILELTDSDNVISISITKILTNSETKFLDVSTWKGNHVDFSKLKNLHQETHLRFMRKFQSMGDRSSTMDENFKFNLIEYY